LGSIIGLEFRATKDLDIVPCIEALDTAFVEAFWAFAHEGDYQVQQKAEGDKQFYRFQRPKPEGFPFMLELFSRSPDAPTVIPGSPGRDQAGLVGVPGRAVARFHALGRHAVGNVDRCGTDLLLEDMQLGDGYPSLRQHVLQIASRYFLCVVFRPN